MYQALMDSYIAFTTEEALIERVNSIQVNSQQNFIPPERAIVKYLLHHTLEVSVPIIFIQADHDKESEVIIW